MSNGRLLYIDNLKAFAITLVVLGHIVQFSYCPDTFDENHLFRYIYSFHMPLFMALSGFCRRFDVSITSIIKKLSLTLLLPFLSWSFIRAIGDGQDFLQCIMDPDTSLWFLWVLYWINICFTITVFFSQKCRARFRYVWCVTFVVLLLCRVILKDMFGMTLIFTHFFYFSFGFFIKRTKFISLHPTSCIILFFVWIAFGWYWMRISAPYFLISYSQMLSKPSMFLWHYITAISGIIGWIYLFSRLKLLNSKTSVLYTIMSYIGRRTLAIYAIHFFLIAPIWNLYRNVILIARGIVEDYMCILLSLATILVVSLIFHKILSMEKHISLVLFGKI